MKNLPKGTPQGPQYTEEERRHRGFVEYGEVLLYPGAIESHEVTAQMILMKLMMRARQHPMGGAK